MGFFSKNKVAQPPVRQPVQPMYQPQGSPQPVATPTRVQEFATPVGLEEPEIYEEEEQQPKGRPTINQPIQSVDEVEETYDDSNDEQLTNEEDTNLDENDELATLEEKTRQLRAQIEEKKRQAELAKRPIDKSLIDAKINELAVVLQDINNRVVKIESYLFRVA